MNSIPRVLFVLGCPASGKGTVCSRLVSQYPLGFSHISAGELLRQERDSGSPSAKIIQECMMQGKIVPVKITVALIYSEILKQSTKSHNKLFLIDGYPRNEDNVQGWNEVIGNKCNVLGCLHFVCSYETMSSRIKQRAKQDAEATGQARVDDKDEVIKKRFEGHLKDTMPIIEDYEKEQKCWNIDAEQDRESVFEETIKVLKYLVPDILH